MARSSVASQGGRNLIGTHLARARGLRGLAAIETALPSIMPLRFGRGDDERRIEQSSGGNWKRKSSEAGVGSTVALPDPLWSVRIGRQGL